MGFTLAVLIERRSRRGWWVHLLWLPLYLFIALFLVAEYQLYPGLGFAKMWVLLIPLVLLALQLYRPTILAWALILTPFVLFTGLDIHYVIRNSLGPRPYDYVGRTVFLPVEIALCVAIASIGWPRPVGQSPEQARPAGFRTS
jgi:hypothetical protein